MRDKPFNNAKNRKYCANQSGLTSLVYKFLIISGGNVKNENVSNNELAAELDKPIIRNLRKRKVHSCFIGSIWGSDLPDMQLISGFDKGTCFLLCVIDIFSNYAWILPLKDK